MDERPSETKNDTKADFFGLETANNGQTPCHNWFQLMRESPS